MATSTARLSIAGWRTRTGRHVVYAGVITAVALVAGYMGILPVFRSHLKDYLGIGDDKFGLLFAIGPVTGLVSLALGGPLIDRWGARRMIRICVTGVGGAMLMVALGGADFRWFAAAAGVAGLFSAPLFIAISAYLAKLFPNHRRRVLSLNLATSSAGGMLFPLAAEGLIHLSEHHPPVTFGQVLHAPFLLAGGLMIGAGFIYRARIPAGPAVSATSRSGWSWRDLLLPPRTTLLALLIALHTTADSMLYYWMARFLESRSFAGQALAPGVVLSGFALAYLVSRTILAALPDKTCRRAFLVLPGITGGGVLIAGILSRSCVLAACGYVLAAFCWSVEYPSMVSALMQCDRKRFGAAMAASGLAGGLMLSLGMAASGRLIEHIGEAAMWKVMLLPACCFPLVGLGGLAWVLLFDREE